MAVKKPPPERTFFEKTETFLSGKMNLVFLACMLLTLVFSLLLFDIRFSLAGDDSAYVARAWDLVHHFTFPSFQGPLYPIILSPVVAITGISAVPLKSLSVLFMFGFVWFFYKAFRNRIPALLLALSMVLLSVNPFLLYYSSQTYTEAFFLFLQSVFLFAFFILFADEGESKSNGKLLRDHLIVAACVLSLGLTRPIGFAAALVIPLYFLLKERWKDILLFLLSFVLITAAFPGLKFLLWGKTDLMFTGQAGSFMAKNFYNPAAGNEDLAGYAGRLIHNSNFYISSTVYTFLGLRPAGDSSGGSAWLTILTILLFLGLMVMVFKKNSYLLFTGIYLAVSLPGIFVITQTMWIQDRYLISYFPLIILVLLSFFYYIFCVKAWSKLQVLLPVMAVILVLISLKISAGEITKARQIHNKYSGLSPDWENYCRISEWCSQNLPENTLVACRKPSVSFIYGKGKTFLGITKLIQYPADSLLETWQKQQLRCCLIKAPSLNNKPVTPELLKAFNEGLSGCAITTEANFNSVQFFVMNFPDSIREVTLKQFMNINVDISENIDTLRSWMQDVKSPVTVVYPDSLLAFLKHSGVTHVLTDNIRAFSDRKNQNVTNLVERFMNFIEAKYPEVRTRIYQSGLDGEEPSVIWELNYPQQMPKKIE